MKSVKHEEGFFQNDKERASSQQSCGTLKSLSEIQSILFGIKHKDRRS